MTLTGEQIRLRGLAALRRELGRAGLVRFLQHFEAGNGDYTRQRRQILSDLTMDDLTRVIHHRDTEITEKTRKKMKLTRFFVCRKRCRVRC